MPASTPGVMWSDHWAFRQKGWPALMVTDTALMRNPSYHAATDTPATVDVCALGRVVEGLETVVMGLADE
jgi:hypothetical protein